MTDYRDGKWHGWNGGPLPVYYQDRIDYVWLHKDEVKGVPQVSQHKNHRAGETVFEGNEYGDLIAFRVVNKHIREWWVHPSVNDVSSSPVEGYVHVREVTDA